MTRVNSRINIDSVDLREFGKLDGRLEVAAVVIKPGELIVSDIGGTEQCRLATPADVNTAIIRVAEEKEHGGTLEVTTYDYTDALENYAVGDKVESYVPTPMNRWGVYVRNDTGLEVNLLAGAKLVLSATTDGHLAPAGTIDATTVVGTVWGQLTKDTTIPATSSVFTTAFYVGQ